MIARLLWTPIANTPDYESGPFVAIYRRTERGCANYWVFPRSLPPRQRTMSRALSVGGLPSALPARDALLAIVVAVEELARQVRR